jgi:hypothetical protein
MGIWCEIEAAAAELLDGGGWDYCNPVQKPGFRAIIQFSSRNFEPHQKEKDAKTHVGKLEPIGLSAGKNQRVPTNVARTEWGYAGNYFPLEGQLCPYNELVHYDAATATFDYRGCQQRTKDGSLGPDVGL